MAKTVSIENIKSEFKVSQSDIDEMSLNYVVETIDKHFQVLRVSNNEWNYLNSELVLDTNSIVLNPKCFENPLERPCSIARGHDYGIMSSLPELSKPLQKAIPLMRLFVWTIHTNNKTSIGNFIFSLQMVLLCTLATF